MSVPSSQSEDCIRHLLRCHRLCLGAAMMHCLEVGGDHAKPQHLRLMLDCADFCMTTADALARKSQFHTRLCDLCADICETCAKDCEALGDMEDCVTACRTCADACRPAARNEHAAALKTASESPPASR